LKFATPAVPARSICLTVLDRNLTYHANCRLRSDARWRLRRHSFLFDRVATVLIGYSPKDISRTAREFLTRRPSAPCRRRRLKRSRLSGHRPRREKKTDAAKRPEVLCRVGLLTSAPPGKPGCAIFSHPKTSKAALLLCHPSSTAIRSLAARNTRRISPILQLSTAFNGWLFRPIGCVRQTN